MLYTFPFTAADPKKLRPWTGQHLKKVFLDKNCSVICLFCNRIICMERGRRKELPEGKKYKWVLFFAGKIAHFSRVWIFYIKCVRSSFMVPATFQSWRILLFSSNSIISISYRPGPKFAFALADPPVTKIWTKWQCFLVENEMRNL